MRSDDTAVTFPACFVAKARAQAEEHSIQHAARNLRKQGVPIEFAVTILAAKQELI